MAKALKKELGFHLELDEERVWWVVWENGMRRAASKETIDLWERLLAEITAQARRRKIKKT